MSQPQLAITPDASPFALYSQLKIKQNHAYVLEQLQALPALVEELNQQQFRQGDSTTNLTLSLSFTHEFWQKLNQPMPPELEPFSPLGSGDITAPTTDVDVLLHCVVSRAATISVSSTCL